MRAVFYADAFASMRQLFQALFYGFKKSSPIVAIDSAYSPSISSSSATARQRIRCPHHSIGGSYASRTRWVCFQQESLSFRIEKVSAKDENGGSKP